MAGYTVAVQVGGNSSERETERAEADEARRRRGHSVEGIESLKRVRRAEERAYGPYRPYDYPPVPVVVYVRDRVTNKRSLRTNRICIRTHNAFEAYLAPTLPCFVSFLFFFFLYFPSFFPAKIKEERSSIRARKRGFERRSARIRNDESIRCATILSFPLRNRNNARQ